MRFVGSSIRVGVPRGRGGCPKRPEAGLPIARRGGWASGFLPSEQNIELCQTESTIVPIAAVVEERTRAAEEAGTTVNDKALIGGFPINISMLLLVTLVLVGCGESNTPPSEPTLKSGVWGTGNWDESTWQ